MPSVKTRVKGVRVSGEHVKMTTVVSGGAKIDFNSPPANGPTVADRRTKFDELVEALEPLTGMSVIVAKMQALGWKVDKGKEQKKVRNWTIYRAEDTIKIKICYTENREYCEISVEK
jgi:hypothetical protein